MLATLFKFKQHQLASQLSQAVAKPHKEYEMTVSIKVLIPPKQAEGTQTTQYTAVNCKAIIDKFTATNTTAGNVTISVNLVTVAGSAAVSNLIVDTRSIAPDETYTFPELVGQALESGSFISTIASAATSLTIRASGREIT
jgi:P pilus assembly chaperone PapD